MIGALLLTLPMLAILLYGVLEIRRARIVGAAILALTTVAVLLIWLPGLAAAAAEVLQLGGAEDVIMVTWVGLVTVILLNLHLRLRRQMQAVTLLARQIALGGRSGPQDMTGPTSLPR